MNYKEFIRKHKKIIMRVAIGLLGILLIVGVFFGIKSLNDNKDESSSTSVSSNVTPETPKEDKIPKDIYVKTINKQNEDPVVDLFDSNPLSNEMLLLLKCNFITLETDWEKAIQKKHVSISDDYSSVLQNNELKHDILKPTYALGLLKNFPKDERGIEQEIKGYDKFHYDVSSNKWTFNLKDNLKFENDKKINNETVKYSFDTNKKILEFLHSDKDEKVYPDNLKKLLATTFIKDEHDELTFSFYYDKPQKLSYVVSFLNLLTLFPNEEFEKSYEGKSIDKAEYGAKEYPFIYYGPYQVSQGYDHEKDWIFKKNSKYFENDKYPHSFIHYKLIENDQEGVQLFNDGKLNELIINDNNLLEYISNKQYIAKDTRGVGYLYFNNFLEEQEDDLEIQNMKTKTNYFVQDPRFRQALFFAIDRQKLKQENLFKFNPTFSFISNITLITDYEKFNKTNFHEENLRKFLNIQENNVSETNLIQNSFNPRKALELFKSVENDFSKTQLGKKYFSPLKIIFRSDGSDFQEKLITSLKSMFEECFSTSEIDIEVETEGDFNLVISEKGLINRDRAHTILVYIADLIKKANGQDRTYEIPYLNKQLSQNELLEELTALQNKSDSDNKQDASEAKTQFF
ncbi:MAG: ABC transporter substrate-binding protein [Candidatus Phytoplasma pruni]|nr:ABC transporter substrate-binding protein [Candidatus Phytoplasma pruni]